jgi:peroxiredoxin
MFWSSACGACGREAHQVERFATTAPGRGRIVGVAFGDSAATAHRFVARHRWTFPNLLDARGAVGRSYGIKQARELPVTYVLDSSGHIFRTLHGAQTEARLAAQLAAAGK